MVNVVRPGIMELGLLVLRVPTGCYRVLQCARECYRVLESASSASGCYTVPVNPQCLLFYRVLHGDTGWYSVLEIASSAN